MTRQQYEQSYSACQLRAQTTNYEEIRALWLSIADGYRLLAECEHQFPLRDAVIAQAKSE
jgi:hypothetical protein